MTEETTMTAWSKEELDQIGRADELELSSRRPDGSLRPRAIIWAVRNGDAIYVRSAYGWNNGWFQRALRSGRGRIVAGGVERDVSFVQPGGDEAEPVTAAYHAKYDHYGSRMVGTVVNAEAVRSTLKIMPE
jgi:hypothetical protein